MASSNGTEGRTDGATATGAADRGGAAGDDAAPTDETGAGADGPPPAVWTGCGTGFECATVAVPLDHDDPGGPGIDIALVRVPASGGSEGSIFVNPGGPGASGVDYVRGGFVFDDETMSRFDLVGFDPRGIGQSTPLTCTIDRSAGPLPDLSPDDEAERAALDEAAERSADDCGASDGELLAHLDTDTVARDLDLLRQAVGDDVLHYYGFSFGTLIGQVYAERFPERVGHLVLDGVVDPSATLPDLLRQQSVAFEEAFEILDAACDTELTCPVGGVVGAYDELLTTLENDGPRGEVGPTEFIGATLITLYDDQLWPVYVTALEDALTGDFALIELLSEAFDSISFAAYAAVGCTDSPRPEGPEAWDRFVDETVAVAPRFGAWVANELRTCAFWPVPAGPARGPITAPGSAPILVIGNTNDPATPLVNAEIVAGQLDNGHLVVVEADSHTAYGVSVCVQEIVAAYFVDDEVPPSPTHCS